MKIINVVSGKGGTGKTLLVAVLAELLSRKRSRVLLVDADIFVRGLTCLLYYQQDRRTRLLNENEMPVAEVLRGGFPDTITDLPRYRGFNVWPAVRRIDDDLDFNEIMPNDFADAKARIATLLDTAGRSWDVIFLDCRAGFDELVAAIHSVSDITLNVQEDDLIAGITSDNLKSQLARVPSKTPVYNLVNKSRVFLSEREDNGPRDLGHIPFDADVRASYGRERFWSSITESLLEPSLINAWNNLCRNEQMDELRMTSTRATPIPSYNVELKLSRLVLRQRIFALYGLIIGIGGLLLGFGGRDFVKSFIEDPFRAFGILMGIGGLIVAFLSVSDTLFRERS